MQGGFFSSSSSPESGVAAWKQNARRANGTESFSL